MWALDNHTPFATDRAGVRDRDGAELWLVAVKGTFDIAADGTTKVAEAQEEACAAPKYSGDPGKTSLRYETDLPRLKLTTDILVNGHAYAPRAAPVRSVEVEFRVGELAKSLRVVGDRFWKWGPWGVRLSRPEPFVKMPIVYERAYGGTDLKSRKPAWDRRNPIGTGYARAFWRLIGQRAPNILAPGFWAGKGRPVGFGAIPGHWAPRAGLTGTCDAKWEAERAPLLPEDFDDRFYQCAPVDQQTKGFLRGGERVTLKNLTPGGTLAFVLPRVFLAFQSDFGAEQATHRANLHTVILEPDVPRVLLVWHSALPCHAKVLKLRRTIITEKMPAFEPEALDGDAEAEAQAVA